MKKVFILSLLFIFLSKNAFANDDVTSKSLKLHDDKHNKSKYDESKGDFHRLTKNLYEHGNTSPYSYSAAIKVFSSLYKMNNEEVPIVKEWQVMIGNEKYPLSFKDHDRINMQKSKEDLINDFDISELQDILLIHGMKSKILIHDQEYNDKNLHHSLPVIGYNKKSDSIVMFDMISYNQAINMKNEEQILFKKRYNFFK